MVSQPMQTRLPQLQGAHDPGSHLDHPPMIRFLAVMCLMKCFLAKRHDPMIQNPSHHWDKPAKVDHAVDHAWIMVDHPPDRHIWLIENIDRHMCYRTREEILPDQYRHI